MGGDQERELAARRVPVTIFPSIMPGRSAPALRPRLLAARRKPGVDAHGPGSPRREQQEDERVDHRELAAVLPPPDPAAEVDPEVGDRHLASQEESDRPGEQAEHDQQASECLERARHPELRYQRCCLSSTAEAPEQAEQLRQTGPCVMKANPTTIRRTAHVNCWNGVRPPLSMFPPVCRPLKALPDRVTSAVPRDHPGSFSNLRYESRSATASEPHYVHPGSARPPRSPSEVAAIFHQVDVGNTRSSGQVYEPGRFSRL